MFVKLVSQTEFEKKNKAFEKVLLMRVYNIGGLGRSDEVQAS
jgi:hypothetical protein